MDIKLEQRPIEKSLLGLGLLVVRLDALLSNSIDFIFVGSYVVISLWFTGLLRIDPMALVPNLAIAALATHAIYSVVYIVNDLIDFDKNRRDAKLLSAFYSFRPINYFNRSKSIVVYTAVLYLCYLCSVVRILSLPSAMVISIAGLLLIQAITHTLSEGNSRVISLCLLRITKYCVFLLLLKGKQDVTDTLILGLPLLVPYSIYGATNYVKCRRAENTFSHFCNARRLSLLTSAWMFSVCIYALSQSHESGIGVVRAAITAAVASQVVIVQFYFLKTTLGYICGFETSDFYHHLKRLSLGFVMAVCILLFNLSASRFAIF